MKHTAATKRKLSEMRKGEKNPFFGKKHSPATLRKLTKLLRSYNELRQFDLKPATLTRPSSETLAYTAALVDGEGSIGFRKKRYPFVAIYNTDDRLIRWLLRNIGGRRSGVDKRGRKACHCWAISSINDVRLFCEMLLPYLVIKKKSAQKVIAFIERKYGKTDRH